LKNKILKYVKDQKLENSLAKIWLQKTGSNYLVSARNPKREFFIFHYGLRNSGIIGHVEHIGSRYHQQLETTSWPSACNEKSNAFLGISCQDDIV